MKSSETNWRDNHFANSEFFAIFIRQQQKWKNQAAPKDTKNQSELQWNCVRLYSCARQVKKRTNYLLAKTKPNIGQSKICEMTRTDFFPVHFASKEDCEHRLNLFFGVTSKWLRKRLNMRRVDRENVEMLPSAHLIKSYEDCQCVSNCSETTLAVDSPNLKCTNEFIFSFILFYFGDRRSYRMVSRTQIVAAITQAQLVWTIREIEYTNTIRWHCIRHSRVPSTMAKTLAWTKMPVSCLTYLCLKVSCANL